MSRLTVFALLSVTVLAACNDYIGTPPVQPAMVPLHSGSIGFTGIGQEPF